MVKLAELSCGTCCLGAAGVPVRKEALSGQLLFELGITHAGFCLAQMSWRCAKKLDFLWQVRERGENIHTEALVVLVHMQ